MKTVPRIESVNCLVKVVGGALPGSSHVSRTLPCGGEESTVHSRAQEVSGSMMLVNQT